MDDPMRRAMVLGGLGFLASYGLLIAMLAASR
jgi:hypothetical protein